ncbi:Glycosyltransferase [Quillaja saponaria]|uniref:Glycosyltransferase n=1 Tax=Quillaja saponaria TaxID=32244 RepID=A0AAD7L2A4_QUISA|nr:Glycosyltransferase [Quillaja saponaria]
MCSAIDAAKDLGISVFTFCTSSPCGMWANMHTSKLIEAACIPGMDDGLLRLRDLPGHCRLELEDPIMEFNISQTTAMTRASALIFNTFQELNKPIISPLKSFFPKIYSIGPLHALFKSLIKDSSLSLSSNGAALRKEDKSCMTWLDQQPLRSVVYVSFGSLIGLSRTQLLEFWYGLVNSGKPFLWVIKMDSVEEGLAQIISGLEEETKKRGYIVGWAPQEEVLAHLAIGGFLTHGGWNSTLESIYAGIPMICWPMFADQQVNSRCVSDLWRIGFDMKDTCDRVIIEKMVRDLMDEKREEIMKSTAEIANMARTSVENGGSSYHNLEMLIDDLTSMNL